MSRDPYFILAYDADTGQRKAGIAGIEKVSRGEPDTAIRGAESFSREELSAPEESDGPVEAHPEERLFCDLGDALTLRIAVKG